MVYLDYNSTCPLDPRVLDEMLPYLRDRFGNASSRDHSCGWDAAEAVETARQRVASLARTTPGDVTFVSGATEGLNTILRGYAGARSKPSRRIVVGATEHEAILAPARHICRTAGTELRIVPTDSCGRVNAEALLCAVAGSEQPLVALMAANNEIGTIHPIRALAGIVHSAGGLLLCDAAQAFGKMPVDAFDNCVDFMTMSAHKIYGPKGVGAIVARGGLGRTAIGPLILGGGQEHGRRGGTVNVPGAVGFGEACRLVDEQWQDDVARMTRLRDRLEEGIVSQTAATWVNGDAANRLCNTSNIGFKGVEARAMIRDMHDIAASTRSACSSGESRPSHVLKAIGLSDEDAFSCVRFSLGRFTTVEEVDAVIAKAVVSAHNLRRRKGVWR